MNKPSETDWDRVDALDDQTIDTSDAPALSDSFFSRATVRPPRAAVEVTLKLDPETLAWFRSQEGAWQDRINAALRLYAEAHKTYHSPPAA